MRGRRRLAGRAGGVARRQASPGRLLLREDPGVVGSAPEDLGADPVPPSAARALAAATERALVDTSAVPARHVAGRALGEGMDARRNDVADGNNGNNKYRDHA